MVRIDNIKTKVFYLTGLELLLLLSLLLWLKRHDVKPYNPDLLKPNSLTFPSCSTDLTADFSPAL